MGEEGWLCQRDEALSFPKLNDTFSIIKATTSKERGGVCVGGLDLKWSSSRERKRTSTVRVW